MSRGVQKFGHGFRLCSTLFLRIRQHAPLLVRQRRYADAEPLKLAPAPERSLVCCALALIRTRLGRLTGTPPLNSHQLLRVPSEPPVELNLFGRQFSLSGHKLLLSYNPANGGIAAHKSAQFRCVGESVQEVLE